ncbi:gamma-glutamylcyclotransferase [Nostoc sp. MS1]|uniref:gamma-glutamylcyclotransferase family protein n=1 Tax=Nostoc sp. MS1 TaxID=2764711 RepID=UPI001CC5FCFB|nr:gamma-glutamylcyclotransferase [Nostoc sp. MS1]BCL38755.1 gamma-glutamylcyclotransferase [Nostoc sp. MS1]
MNVFVYGTLKPDERNYLRYCAGKVVEAQRATTLGRLFALPMGYPAMTMGKDIVHGYLLSFADLGVLATLDGLEDYQPERAMSENLYNRQNVKIFNLLGSSLGLAWVYLMQPKTVKQLGGIYLPDGWWSGNSFKCL